MMRLLCLLAVFFLAACNTAPVTSVQNTEFIELFKQAEATKQAELIQVPEVKTYMLGCCRSEDEVIQLLENNGFQIKITRRSSNPEFFEENRRSLAIRQDEITLIGASRELFLMPLKRRTYSVGVHLNKDGVTSASGRIKKPTPL